SSIVVNGNVTINGIDFSDIRDAWHVNDSHSAIYSAETLAGGYSVGNTIQYRGHSYGSDIIVLGGINSTDGFSVASTTVTYSLSSASGTTETTLTSYFVTLDAGGFSDAVSIIKTSGDLTRFDLIGSLSNRDRATFTGTSGTDLINNEVDNLSIYGASGSDFIENSGSNLTIDGGNDGDIIENYGSSVSIDGGKGDDWIVLSGGSNVTVNVNDGEDWIELSGGSYVTTIASSLSDAKLIEMFGTSNWTSIQADFGYTPESSIEVWQPGDTNVTEFTVENFDAGDVIQFNGSISGISSLGNNRLAVTVGNQVVTINGINNVYGTKEGWTTSSDSIAYGETITPGVEYIGSFIVNSGSNSSANIFTIEGLSTSTGLNVNRNDKVVTVGQSAPFNEDYTRASASSIITIDNDYKLSLGYGGGVLVSLSGTRDATINQDGVYVIKAGFSGTIKIEGDAKNVKIIGAKDANGYTVTLNEVFIDATKASDLNLWIEDLDIRNQKVGNNSGKIIAFGSSTGNTLTLKGDNNLVSDLASSGAQGAVVDIGGGLTIIGDGKLTIEEYNGIGTGIGSGNYSNTNGNINIGGNVTINVVLYSVGAGIGSGLSGTIG
ncbi:MAG: hypothetical protein J5497_01830, partial [Selenomonadaceae bacterium]|nr:hypothetical protein [Selenomonadaceae bacterium]